MLLLLALVSVALAHASEENFDGNRVFRVSVHDEDDVSLIQELANTKQIDFWKPDSATQVKPLTTVDFHVKAEDVVDVENFLEENEVLYEVLISNVKHILESQFDSHTRASGHSYTKYNNWETIEAWIQQVANDNPDLVSKRVIGTTFEGRNMYVLKIGKDRPNKPAFFIDCGFHAREWISPAFCQWFVREAVRTYKQEIHMKRLLDELDFYVLPVVNIDGYVYTWAKDRMWRKTRSTTAGSSCFGVDPNRNFDAGWCEVGASRSPCSDTYCGPTPESEKETKALADFIRQNLSSIKAYLTVHSYSQMMLYPYSYDYKLPENYEELNALVKGAAKELSTLHGTKYTYGPGATTIYPAAGGSDDWAYDQGIKYSFTFELRDKGFFGFLLPESQIRQTCEETMLAVKEKVFRVKLQNEKHASVLKNLTQSIELDFWYPDAIHDIAVNMTVDFRVSEKESQTIQSTLEQHKIHYEILIHDLQEEIEKQFDVKDEIAGRHSYAKYNDWDKIVSWTEKMLEKHPEMVSRIKIGSTVEDNPLYVLKIGKKDGERKAIFMDCGIHAREWISPAFCQWFVYQATKSYGKNKIMTKLLDRMNFYVLPVFNVDGYIWSWTQDRMWRKNRSRNQNSTCIGTDLNRNFDVSWDSSPNTNKPCLNVYRGPAPESEKETKAVTNFIRSHLNSIKAYITFHSYSQMLLIPYGYTFKLPPNHQDLLKVARIATDALSTRYETRYIYGPIASTIYKTSGSSLDWVYDLGIKHTFAFELRDKGKSGFLLPESRIKPTCKETMLSVKFIAKYILKNTS